MNDQCHDCKIRKLCYLEEPKEDWTCDHYEPCEYDEEVATDINVGDKDTISRQAVKEILDKHQLRYHIYPNVWDEINALPPAHPEIIRCKDCRHFKQVFAPNDNDGLCGHWHSKCDARTSREGYCSHAERKEETE